jgi:hypothetical protein
MQLKSYDYPGFRSFEGMHRLFCPKAGFHEYGHTGTQKRPSRLPHLRQVWQGLANLAKINHRPRGAPLGEFASLNLVNVGN